MVEERALELSEKIKAIEEEMGRTQIHKHTEHHVGLLKAKLARLRAEQVRSQGSKRGGIGFELKKGGDCTVVLIGLPSVGKSTLLNRLTNARSKVASYAFTTVTLVPGLLEYKGAKIQILDLPGIVPGAARGTGKGKRVLSVARNADLVLLVVDVFQPDQVGLLRKELHEIGVRINSRPPNVTIEKRNQGSLGITATCNLSKLPMSTIREMLNVYGINHGGVVIREDVTIDEFVDVVAGNRRYIPAITVLNKMDLVNPEYLAEVRKRLDEDFIAISADRNMNLDQLKETIYSRLNLIRIYLKPRNGPTDLDAPLILTAGSTIADVCAKIYRRTGGARYALVSGTSVRFSPQRVGMDHVVHDQDIVTIVGQ